MHCITKCLCGKKYMKVFILSTSVLVLNEWLEVGSSWNKFNFCNNIIIAQGLFNSKSRLVEDFLPMIIEKKCAAPITLNDPRLADCS